MPKEKLALEDVIAEIEDTLGDLLLPWDVLERVKKPRLHLHPGYYVHYRISTWDIDRVYFLGEGVKVGELKRKFSSWSMNWRV